MYICLCINEDVITEPLHKKRKNKPVNIYDASFSHVPTLEYIEYTIQVSKDTGKHELFHGY